MLRELLGLLPGRLVTCLPRVEILITTLAFNLLGDSVRDAFDPRGDRLFRR